MIATEQTSNPEFPTPIAPNSRKTTTVEAQLFTLRNAIGQLRNAYNGHDVEWSDVGELNKDISLLLIRCI